MGDAKGLQDRLASARTDRARHAEEARALLEDVLATEDGMLRVRLRQRMDGALMRQRDAHRRVVELMREEQG